MSENRLAGELFAARKRAVGDSDREPLSSVSPRIQRQYTRFAEELRPVLDQAAADAPADVETRVFNAFADADERGVVLDGLSVAELTALVMDGIRNPRT